MRLCNQFEEGQQFPVHLVTCPKKAKLSPGPMRIHLQNMRFSLTSGVPPVLVHTWDLVDLRYNITVSLLEHVRGGAAMTTFATKKWYTSGSYVI